MEFEIKNMGLTIAVGGLAFGGVYLALLLLNFNPFTLIPQQTGHGHKFLFSAIGLAIVFGSGVLLEGVSQRLTAQRDNHYDLPILFVEKPFVMLVDNDKKLRFQIFFDVTNDSGNPETWWLKYQPIAQDLMLAVTNDPLTGLYVSNLRARFTNGCPTNAAGWFAVTGKTNYDWCVEQVNNAFYKAKNSVYQNDNYFSELGAIETRKNFMLAMMADLLFLMSAHLLLGLAYVVRKRWRKEPLTFSIRSSRQRLYVAILLAYGIMFYCANLGYQVESSSYNSRVFGYYGTLWSQKDAAAASGTKH